MDKSLLKLQIGPVQEFIAQARSTRDLWSGSYLISWLMAHAIKGLQDSCARNPSDQVEIIFPMIAVKDDPNRPRQPLVRYLREFKPGGPLPNGLTAKQILAPNLPNLLLAVVPGNWTKKEVGEHVLNPMKEEWKREVEACLKYYEDQFRDQFNPKDAFTDDEAKLFRLQTECFWQFTWQLWPMHDPKTLLDFVKGMPGQEAIEAHLTQLIRNGAGADDDKLWQDHFLFVSHRLDARRQTRDFDAWPVTPLATRDKDSLSGREEAIANKDWLAEARALKELRYRFRSGDELGAPNLIKRVWDLAYLRQLGLVRSRISYDSVPGIAAAPWLNRFREKLNTSRVDGAFAEFIAAVRRANELVPIAPWESLGLADSDPLRWLDQVDAQIFHVSTWETWLRETEDQETKRDAGRRILPDAITALRQLYEVAGVGRPACYFAILALDGDEMGAWLSGAKHAPNDPLTRTWHERFSQALATFAFDHVRKSIEDRDGQAIYAGGDDVLAMLPAETAMDCANDLAKTFRECVGSVAPGCAASVGLAIAHMHTPLQNVAEAARLLEHRAKETGGYGRSAFALGLFKRSGEEIVWGAKWEDKAIELASSFHALSQPLRNHAASNSKRKAVLSSRFPYVLAGLLEAATRGFKSDQTWTYDPGQFKNWFEREFAHVCAQQCDKTRLENDAQARADFEAFQKAAKSYWDECKGRRLSDLLGPFLTTAFLHRENE